MLTNPSKIIEAMSDEEFTQFLSLLPPEVTEADKQVMITHRAWIKLFTDPERYVAIRDALATALWAEFNK